MKICLWLCRKSVFPFLGKQDMLTESSSCPLFYVEGYPVTCAYLVQPYCMITTLYLGSLSFCDSLNEVHHGENKTRC